jgi:Uma2 family endonuclease
MSQATVTPPPKPSATARMSAEEFGLRYSGQRVEYIDGTVKEIPMPGGMHGIVVNWIAYYLTHFVITSQSGRIFSADTFMKVPTRDDPERVYGADVSYVSYSKLSREAEIPAGLLPVLPELVIEVRSPSDTWANVFTKVGDYLGAGVTAVVVLDVSTRTASVYRDSEANPQQFCNVNDTLTLPDVLPGFAVPVASLFVS